jgi:tetratricopeptide (TPR) repeat protein
MHQRTDGKGADVNPRHHGLHMLWILIPILLLVAGTPLAADQPIDQDQAMALLREGKLQQALQAFDAIIASNPPDPSAALYSASMLNLEDGDWRAAKPYVKRLVKLRPASFQAWELMIQVDQADGDLQDRDDAIRSLYETWHRAQDPETRAKVSFVRDRIAGPKHTLLGQQALDPGGGDVLRFQFQPTEELAHPRHVIVVRSDDETNSRWRENGTVSYGTVVYHLDTVEQIAVGQITTRPYEYYLEPPDYDRVRAKVVEILAGTAQPLSGQADPFWAGEPAQ